MRSIFFHVVAAGASIVAGPVLAEMAAPRRHRRLRRADHIEQAKKAAAAAPRRRRRSTLHGIAVVSRRAISSISRRWTTRNSPRQHRDPQGARGRGFRRPTSSFEERVGAGGVGLTLLTLDDVIASPGAIIIVGGKLIGAIASRVEPAHRTTRPSLAGVAALK